MSIVSKLIERKKKMVVRGANINCVPEQITQNATIYTNNLMLLVYLMLYPM